MLRPTVTARHDTKFCPTKYPILGKGLAHVYGAH